MWSANLETGVLSPESSQLSFHLLSVCCCFLLDALQAGQIRANLSLVINLQCIPS